MGTYLSYQKKEKFFVILCGDVLLEVLQFGNRRQLVKLERVGRRLHWIVDDCFGCRPFLRLRLNLMPSWQVEAYIFGSANIKNEISLANLTFCPHFLRFNEVEIFYTRGSKSIEEKCRSIENCLQPLKEALKDSNFIRFWGDIDRNDHIKFSDHSKLLEYISEELLTICNSSRGYDFTIIFYSEKEAGTNVINSIIQMPQVCRCSNLHFNLCFILLPMLLPVEAISSWLNRSIGDGMNFNGRRTPQEIFLRIYAPRIQNAVEMCNHLAKTFEEAKTPTLAYTFQLKYSNYTLEPVEQKMLQNAKTSEEFSIHKDGPHKIVIKRMAAKKKKN